MNSAFALVLAVLVAAVSSGNVDYDRCGGIGTVTAIRISDCEGRVCWMNPGTQYLCEADFYPSHAIQSLSLRVTLEYLNTRIEIINAVLPGSSVQPGALVTVGFRIVPNDILANQYVPIESEVYDTNASTAQICAGFHVRVNPVSA